MKTLLDVLKETLAVETVKVRRMRNKGYEIQSHPNDYKAGVEINITPEYEQYGDKNKACGSIQYNEEEFTLDGDTVALFLNHMEEVFTPAVLDAQEAITFLSVKKTDRFPAPTEEEINKDLDQVLERIHLFTQHPLFDEVKTIVKSIFK